MSTENLHQRPYFSNPPHRIYARNPAWKITPDTRPVYLPPTHRQHKKVGSLIVPLSCIFLAVTSQDSWATLYLVVGFIITLEELGWV